MTIAIDNKTIHMVDKGGAIIPTSTAGRLKLLELIKREAIPYELRDMFFPRIVKAGYKLAIKNV